MISDYGLIEALWICYERRMARPWRINYEVALYHVLIYGSKKFVKKIKNRYIVSAPDPAVPQQKSIFKSSHPLQY